MYQKILKRIIDISLGILLLPLLLIVFSIIGPLIYLEDKGPIMYNSYRLGKDGQEFIMYKFRSMKIDSKDIRNDDGSTYSSNHDERLTTIGRFIRKTSIDELPQLLNVIKGDMSFIGPRPTILTGNFFDIPLENRIRYQVKPGITGYTQAYFRNSITQEEKFRYDNYYVENVSLKLDFKIFLKTIKTVVFKENVFTSHEKEI